MKDCATAQVYYPAGKSGTTVAHEQVVSVLDAHNVRLMGQGERVVVLSHGFGANQDAWKHIVTHLVPDYRVVVYNLKGHSSTAPDNSNLDLSRYQSIQAFAEDLTHILDELQIKKCVYVGHSVSGMIGCIAAAARPGLFERVILIGASPRYLTDVNYHGGFEQDQVDQLLLAIEKDCASWVRGFAPLALGTDAPEDAIHQYTSSFLNLRPDFTLVAAKAIFQSDLRSILPSLTVPCHIIQTRKDFAVPLAVAEYLQQNLGGEEKTLEILQADGHLPHMSCPHLLIPVLKKLLQR